MAHPSPSSSESPDTAAPTRRDLSRVLAALCVTQIVTWGVLYYAFPVMLDAIVADTGWSATGASAAFSGGLIVSALIGVPVGWLLERRGPRVVMTAGSCIAVPCSVGIALAPNLAVFAIAWLAAGIAMAATLYTAAFTAVTGWFGTRRVQGITTVTLVGGLSSTVFAPITSYLMDHVNWRTAFLILTVALAVITIPTNWFGLRLPWKPVSRQDASTPVGPIVRSVPFIGFALGVAVIIFCGFAACLLLVSLGIERGYSRTFGAVLLGMVGVGLVLGRGSYVRLAGRLSIRARIPAVYLSTITVIVLFGIISKPAAVLVVMAVLLGAARGAGTLMQATFVADFWGTERYGALNGIFSAPMTIGMALAPFGGTAIAELTGSYSSMMLVLAAIAAIALGGMLVLTWRLAKRASSGLAEPTGVRPTSS